jgi:hypothetical protein
MIETETVSGLRSLKSMSARAFGHLQTGENTLSTRVGVIGRFSSFRLSLTAKATADPVSTARMSAVGSRRGKDCRENTPAAVFTS